MLLLQLFAAAAALLQNAPPQTPIFKAGVELARLDITVVDADGAPIRDLRQNEVEVSDAGTRLPLILFQHVEETGESLSDVASRTIASEVSTNQGAPRGQLYVIVFDQIHIAAGNEQRARLAAQRFVTRLRPGDRVALYAIPGPGPQIPFTGDFRRVARALQEVHGTGDKEAFGALGAMSLQEAFEIVRGNDLVLQRVADRVQVLNTSDAQFRGNQSLSTGSTPLTLLVKEDARKIVAIADGQSRAMIARFADVLRPLRAIEGRKAVLFISEGFQDDRLSREMDDVAAAAAQSSSVVHAFEVNRREVDIAAATPVGADQANDIRYKLSPLGSLATETGGNLIIDAGARPDHAFAVVTAHSTDYYVIGFSPPSEAPHAGEYRRVKVKVSRPGARVITRTGFTLADSSLRLNRQQAIDRALSAPFPQQAVPISYTTYVMRGSAAGVQSVVLAVEAELPVAPEQEYRVADVVFVARAVGDGRVVASGRDTMPLPSASDANATTGTGRFKVQFDAPPGDYVMRLVVREPGGLLGSADRHFAVRALEGPSVTTTDLLIGSGDTALSVHPDAYTDDGLSALFEVYARTAGQLADARAVVELIPSGEAVATVSGEADLRELRETGSGVVREGRTELPIASVAPGIYRARVRIVRGPDTLTETVRTVNIRHGRRPLHRATAAAEPSKVFDASAVATSAVARQFERELAAAQTPTLPSARTALERLAARDYPAAIAAFDAVLAAEPANAAAAFLLGWTYHGAGDDRLAIGAWRRAAYVRPDFIPAHLALADIFVSLSQPALARQALQSGLAAAPESPELRDRLARLDRP